VDNGHVCRGGVSEPEEIGWWYSRLTTNRCEKETVS
jgi:hypothetical protein